MFASELEIKAMAMKKFCDARRSLTCFSHRALRATEEAFK
jgi:hypothetical protein